MRRVYVTYKSGKTKEFQSIGKAAEALNCVDSTVLRLSQGKAPTIAKAHNIESVEIKENRGVMHRINPRQGKHPLRVTNEKTGESFDCESLKEAIEKTRFRHYLHNCIDTGQYHWGWKFDTIHKQKSEIKDFDANNITNDQIRTIYKMAWYQMKKFMYWSNDLKEDAVQYAVEHVASKLSTGKWHSRTPDDSMEGWMWYEVRTWLSKYATREIKWRELQADGESEITTQDNDLTAGEKLIENVVFTEDEDWLFLKDIPDELRPLAECLIFGLRYYEIEKELGINTRTRLRLMDKLRNWYNDNKE